MLNQTGELRSGYLDQQEFQQVYSKLEGIDISQAGAPGATAEGSGFSVQVLGAHSSHSKLLSSVGVHLMTCN